MPRGRTPIQTAMRAKNQIFPQVRERLLDLGRAAGENWRNSIEVEGLVAQYWPVLTGGRVCSCRGVSIGEQYDEDVDTVGTTGITSAPQNDTSLEDDDADGFTVTGSKPLSLIGRDDSEDDDTSLDTLINQTADSFGGMETMDSTYGDGIDCAICYRNGMQPSYALTNGHRVVLSALDCIAVDNRSPGTVIDMSNSPATLSIPAVMHGNDLDSYAEFMLQIPKYFVSVRAAVYVDEHPPEARGTGLHAGQQWIVTNDADAELDLARLRQFAGQTIVIRVRGPERFTHIVYEFMLNEPIKVSLPQLQKLRDYRRLTGIPSVQIVVSNRVTRAQVHDVVYIPQFNLMFKITAVNPLSLPDGYQVGWNLDARVVQPVETLLTIAHTTEIR